MPAISVWPVSESVCTRKVGSSWRSLASPWLSFSWSALVFGSIARRMTGSGNSIDSSKTGDFGSQIVSPVIALLRPTMAAMSPAQTSLISSRLFACILRSRPILSDVRRALFHTWWPVTREPE